MATDPHSHGMLTSTSHKQAEEALRLRDARLRVIFDHQPDCVEFLDREGNVLDMNPAGLRIVEADTLTQIQGQCIFALIAEEHREAFCALHERVLNGVSGSLIFDIIGLKGTPRTLETHKTPLRDAFGAVFGTLGFTRDITEHKRAEKALRETEARLRLALQAGRIGIWDWDMTTGKIVWSREHEEMWGMAPGEFKGTYEEFDARLHPDDRDGLQSATASALADRHAYRHEFRVVWPDGSVHWISGHGEPFFDNAGNPVRIVGTVKDITGRKQSEALRQGQNQVLELIADGAPLQKTLNALLRVIEAQSTDLICSILLLDTGGSCLRLVAAPSVPESYVRAVGSVPVGEGIGSCGTAAFRRAPVISEDIATDTFWAEYRALALSHGFRACWSTPIFDAQRRVLGTFAVYFRTPGRPTERHFLLVDMATHTAAIAISKQEEQEALRENQRALSTLMSNLPGMAYRCRNDRNWTTEFVSEGCYELTGYRPADMIGNEKVSYGQLMHPDDRAAGWDSTQAALQEKRPFQLVYRIITADKKEKWVWEQGEGVFSENGDVLALEGFIIDITQRKRMEEALRENQSFLEQSQEVGGIGSWVSGLGEDKTLWWSRQTYRIFGIAVGAQVNLDTFFSVVHPDDIEPIRQAVENAIVTRSLYTSNHRILLPDGSQRWVFERAEVIFDLLGRPAKLIGVIQDITERKEQQDKIARLSRIYAVLSGINSAIIRIRDRDELFRETCRIAITEGAFRMAWIGTIDPATQDGGVVAWAGGTQGYIDKISFSARPDTQDGDRMAGTAAREQRPMICNDIAAEASLLGALREELLEMGHRSGASFPLLVGARAVAVLTLFADEAGFFDADELRLLNELAGDIAFGLQYIEKEEALNYLAYHDTLTNLPNRNLLVDRLTQAISYARRAGGRPLALLFVDLDGFKHINDSFGHAFGDGLLRIVAERVQKTLRDGDTVARQGGDEFIVLLTDLEKPEDTGLVAAKLLKALARPFTLGGRELYVTASIGACLHPDDGEDIETLLKNADTALYRVKEEGGNGFRYYARDMGERAMARMELEAALRRALERQEFVLHYQPKADLKTKRIIGAEALIRWQPPEEEMVLPEEFISVAEQVGLIGPIGEWVLHTACAQIRGWQDAGLPHLGVSINVSARQFRHETLGQQISDACRQAGLDPRYLEIELTESTVMRNVEESIVTLKELKALGLPLAIDDFGTGYSSLEHLKRFPFDRIKIDRSFVRDIGDDPDDEAIVRSMISLGHSLGLKVIAEGVETAKQAAFLRSHRCDEMQGYLVGKPLPAAEFAAFLQKHKALIGVAGKRRARKK